MSAPRYSRRMVDKLRGLRDGGVARFQIGDARLMALKLGQDLFVRPFGDSGKGKTQIWVNDVPVVALTPFTFDDVVRVGERAFIFRDPNEPVDEERSLLYESVADSFDTPRQTEIWATPSSEIPRGELPKRPAPSQRPKKTPTTPSGATISKKKSTPRRDPPSPSDKLWMNVDFTVPVDDPFAAPPEETNNLEEKIAERAKSKGISLEKKPLPNPPSEW